ncbi:MAG: endonuclease MutS2 [Eubacterium sp.]|nr:endonuclease MutS2 [Eubacterium sp.]
MNEKALNTLEFHKITDRLSSLATCPLGQAACRALKPLSELTAIDQLQEETSAALGRLFRNGTPSFGGAKDIFMSFKRLEAGSPLSVHELLMTADLLETAGRAKAYGHADEKAEPDCLTPVFQALEPLPLLSSRIRHCIISEEEISSDASPELRRIRRAIRTNADRIRTQMTELMNGSLRTYLQDAVVTMRDGRYCLPVKAEYRASVPGMIHDQSSTGATLFIEPMAIVRLNNDIRALEIQEEREIERILAELSEETAVYSGQIRQNLQYLVSLDFIFARAKLAMDMNATRPLLNSDGIIELRKARHPLIPKGDVVPIDINLGKTFDLLIVTGPNTGGKTVSLKTIGLLTLMGQAGLHIPALDRSSVAVFREVYADIGDEQSIEQSLSTFSSHMTNTVSFLEKADRDSLVLFDELGAGTDPTEGAALAIAILQYLHQQGIRTMATTHYSELKLYALQTEGVENASCEFDVSTLRPTYKLLIGVPGKSNAFAISRRLGLPDHIIELARTKIDEQDASFEDVLSSLEERRLALERQYADLAQARADVEDAQKSWEDRQRRLNNARDRVIREANEEARAILQSAKDYADQTIKDVRKLGSRAGSLNELEKRRSALRGEMSKHEKKLAAQPARRTSKELRPEDIRPGDSVKVLSMNLKGIVASTPDSKGNLFVRMGIMRTKVNINDLELLTEPEILTEGKASPQKPAPKKKTPGAFGKSGGTGASNIRMDKSMSAGMEINLLGKTVDEASAALDKFIDDAYLAHISTVRIIHGKGTGRLREGVHTYLRSHRLVKKFRLAEFGEGDAGVTIAELRE